jgi:hypothetical protein
MSAISKINKSNLNENERIRLKTLIIEKPDIREQIEEDDQVNDKLLKSYLAISDSKGKSIHYKL